MMYTCEESELGGTRSFAVTDAKQMIAEQAARQGRKGEGKPAEKVKAGSGTPLGRAFRKFTKK